MHKMSKLTGSGRLARAMLAAVAGVLVAGAVAPSSHAAVVYSDTTPRPAAPGEDSLYYQVQNPNRILFDDVPVNVTGLTNPTATVTRVSFDVTQIAGAPGTTVTAYYAPMVADALQNGGPDDFAGSDDPGAPVAIGSFTLGSTTDYARSTVTFGNGTTPLFTVPLDTNQNPGGPGYFFLGLQFSATSNRLGWTIADPGPVDPNGYAANGNIDQLFDYGSPTSFSEFTYGQDANNPPQNIAGAQMMTVEGNVVPEPAAIGVLLLTATTTLMRRRR